MKRIVCLLACLLSGGPLAASGIYNVKDFGANGVCGQYATQGIQAAIDQCAKDGGGTVLIPSGEYLCATLILKDNVTLYLCSGATLLASNRESDYTRTFSFADTGGGGVPMLIYAQKAKNITITGRGTIKGQPQYETEPLGYSSFIAEDCDAALEAGVPMIASRWKKPNVSLVFLSECSNVLIRDISLVDSPFWALHLHWCDKVRIRGIYMSSRLTVATNSDGIDIDGCQDVVVSDCILETADVCICLKTTKGKEGFRHCENVSVNNCILKTSSCALKIGTESYGDFRNVLFTNCIVHDSNRGLGIFIRDGGTAENITFSNIEIQAIRYPVGWWGSADAFRFVVLKRNDDSKIGAIRHLTLENIRAVCQGSNRIAGFDAGQQIESVSLRNISLRIEPEPMPDKRAREALSITNARQITVDGLNICWTGAVQPKWSHSIVFDHTHAIKTREIEIENQPNGLEPIITRN